MQKLEIKREALPQRCEICHKTDSFDPKNNYCLRCSNIFARNLQVKEDRGTKVGNKNINESSDLFVFTFFFVPFSVFLWILLFSEYGVWYIESNLLGILIFLFFLGLPFLVVFFLPKLVYYFMEVLITEKKDIGKTNTRNIKDRL